MDAKFSGEFSLGTTGKNLTGDYFIKIENLLDKNYIEIPFVPMPPRTISAGVKIEF
ncbi:MAG: hypothetical protein PHE88_01630 [Elusimicrobia bacterium]|nr:hypothetical protein [Elusimicrobiota bacterium]